MNCNVLGAAVTVEVREMDLFSPAADSRADEALREPVQGCVFRVRDVVVCGIWVGEALVEVGGCGTVLSEPDVVCAAVAVQVGKADGRGGGDGHVRAGRAGERDGFDACGGAGAVGADAGFWGFGAGRMWLVYKGAEEGVVRLTRLCRWSRARGSDRGCTLGRSHQAA